jgi:hypothetical protein
MSTRLLCPRDSFVRDTFGRDPFGRDPFGRDPFGRDPFVAEILSARSFRRDPCVRTRFWIIK